MFERRDASLVFGQRAEQSPKQAEQLDGAGPGLIDRDLDVAFTAQYVLETPNFSLGQAEAVASFGIHSMIVHEDSVPLFPEEL